MKKQSLHSLLASGPIILDGATGTWLQAHGLPSGACPEQWLLDNPHVLQDLQTAYYNAGSKIVYAFTFGANRPKLIRHGISPDAIETINFRLARLSCDVRDRFRTSSPHTTVLVAGDLAPTGEFLQPAGTLSFEELVAIYKEQVRALITADVDLFVVETMFDLAQTRAAVIAIRELSQLPVMVSMTLEAHGRTLSGDDPLNCLLSLISLGADVFGLNCSQGPAELCEWLEPLMQVSPVPLLAKPNAGLPVQVDGKTLFPMQADQFADQMMSLAHAGVRLLGGCCGTDTTHISALADAVLINQKGLPEFKTAEFLPQMIGSTRLTWQADPDALPLLPLLSPADPEVMTDELLAISDDQPPAIILDFSVLAGISVSELAKWTSALLDVQLMISQPLIFYMRSGLDRSILSQLARIYHGRPGIMAAADPLIPGTCFIRSETEL